MILITVFTALAIVNSRKIISREGCPNGGLFCLLPMMLEVVDIAKTYPGADLGAVSYVSFKVRDNEVLALVGKSGSGKSTVLQIVAGLMRPDSGHVMFGGEVLENPEEQLIAGHKDIKMVFQDFQLKPNMTVSENVRYMLLQFDKDFQRDRTLELLDLCGIAELGNRKPSELSGGQRQRLSIACALAEEPKLLLMDEPFSNLDPITKQGLLIELVDIIKSEELSLIFVTHDTRDAMLVADKIAFLSGGELTQNDTVINIYQKPLTIEVAGFFGRINDVSEVTSSQNTYVRAEKMLVTNDTLGLRVKLIKSIFQGQNYLHECQSEKSGKHFFLYSSDKLTDQKNGIHLQFSPQDVLRFIE